MESVSLSTVKTRSEFRTWLLDRIDRLACDEKPGDTMSQLDSAAAVVEEAAMFAARLGFADLHRRGSDLSALVSPVEATIYLSECLARCAESQDEGEFPPLMTEQETIRYLRLDTDERDPKERLRNLVRRQRLPQIRRGKLRLFRKTKVDAWLDERK